MMLNHNYHRKDTLKTEEEKITHIMDADYVVLNTGLGEKHKKCRYMHRHFHVSGYWKLD